MSHSKPSITTFQVSYSREFPWVKPHPTFKTTAICTWCNKDINIAGMGRTALNSHAKSKKHASIEAARKKTLAFFNTSSSTNNAVGLPGPSTSQTLPLPNARSGDLTQLNLTPVPTSQTDSAKSQLDSAKEQSESEKSLLESAKPPKESAMKKYLLSQEVSKSEVFWCLQIVSNHIPFRAAARCANSFGKQFPDSQIAEKIKLDRTKVGYVVVYGLAPYFQKELEKKLKESSNIVLCFDESLNKVSQRQQMDLLIRFWDASKQQVITNYYTSVFLGHTTATDLLESIKNAISSELLKKMTQVSMDGPNVNKKLFNDLQADLLEYAGEDSPTLLNIGTCGLHTIHGAFKTGISATKWDLVEFLRALYNLFKNSPARRADFIYYSKTTIFPLKFCAVRWVESGRVAERALSILPALKSYVDGVVKEKKEPLCNSFTIVKKHLNDQLLPAKLAFFNYMTSFFQSFLLKFQTDQPMAPFLYNEIKSLVLSLVEKVVKKEHLEQVKNRVEKIDFSVMNVILTKHIDLGFGTKSVLKTCVTTDNEILNLKKGAKDAIIAMAKKIIEKSPMKYSFSRAITCLDPSVIKDNNSLRDSLLDKTLEELVEKKWISGSQADRIKKQYSTLFSNQDILDKCKAFKKNTIRLDDFFMQIIRSEEQEELKDLRNFIELILTLSHGNATTERGFSVNKECLIENLQEESLIALRLVCDSVAAAGGVEKIEMSQSLLHYAKNSHARYTEHLAKKREELKEKVEIEKEKKRSMKEKKELELEQSTIMCEARKRSAELQEKIEAINKKFKY